MEYRKIINLLENTANKPTRFRTKNWVEINDRSRRMYNINSQIRLKTSMLRSSLSDYSDAYILIKGAYCVKSAQIRSFFCSVLSCIQTEHREIRIWRDAEYLSVFSQNLGKYGLEKTPYLVTFHTVNNNSSKDCSSWTNRK